MERYEAMEELRKDAAAQQTVAAAYAEGAAAADGAEGEDGAAGVDGTDEAKIADEEDAGAREGGSAAHWGRGLQAVLVAYEGVGGCTESPVWATEGWGWCWPGHACVGAAHGRAAEQFEPGSCALCAAQAACSGGLKHAWLLQGVRHCPCIHEARPRMPQSPHACPSRPPLSNSTHPPPSAAYGDVKKRVRTAGGGSTGSVRNLRIREDTAKYLLNLDLNSAHYDPKTRSMREDPQPHKDPKDKNFHGDNFVRNSGDVAVWQALNAHSTQAFDRGQEVHAMALPSLAEKMYSQFKAKKATLEGKSKTEILDKYGSAGEGQQAHVQAPCGGWGS